MGENNKVSKRIGILPEFVPWGAPKGEVHRGGTAASPGHSPYCCKRKNKQQKKYKNPYCNPKHFHPFPAPYDVSLSNKK